MDEEFNKKSRVRKRNARKSKQRWFLRNLYDTWHKQFVVLRKAHDEGMGWLLSPPEEEKSLSSPEYTPRVRTNSYNNTVM